MQGCSQTALILQSASSPPPAFLPPSLSPPISFFWHSPSPSPPHLSLPLFQHHLSPAPTRCGEITPMSQHLLRAHTHTHTRVPPHQHFRHLNPCCSWLHVVVWRGRTAMIYFGCPRSLGCGGVCEEVPSVLVTRSSICHPLFSSLHRSEHLFPQPDHSSPRQPPFCVD